MQSTLFILLISSAVVLTAPTEETQSENVSTKFSGEVKDDKVICIKAEFIGKIVQKDGSDIKEIPIDGKVNNGSSCDEVQQKLAIDFGKTGDQIVFNFAKKDDQIVLSSATVTINGNETWTSKSETNLFESPIHRTFSCKSGLKFEVTKTNETATVELTNVKLDVYRDNDKDDYEPEQICSADNESTNKTNKTVPIIMAVILTGIILIVLVVYFILRQRQSS